MPFLKLVCFTR